MSVTNKELLIECLKQKRNHVHGKLNELLTRALRTIPPSFDDVRIQHDEVFNTECQRLVHDIKDYSERLGKLED